MTIADRELVLIRLIDAPREKLYRCWTAHHHQARAA